MTHPNSSAKTRLKSITSRKWTCATARFMRTPLAKLLDRPGRIRHEKRNPSEFVVDERPESHEDPRSFEYIVTVHAQCDPLRRPQTVESSGDTEPTHDIPANARAEPLRPPE